MKLTDYEIVRHGVELPDYFQGCGVSFTRFEHVATGIGDMEKEAFDDALEQIAMSDSLDDGELERLESENKQWDEREASHMVAAPQGFETQFSEDIPYWHVSIRYNVA
jgi:hypothetical protein